MKRYTIVSPVILSFLEQEQFDHLLNNEHGHLEFDGKNITFVDTEGNRQESITTNNAIDIWLEQGLIKGVV